MARRYSGRKGKHGSKKPAKKTVPAWVTYKRKDVEMLIAKFAKEGRAPSSIGHVLRDTYGIPDVKTMTSLSIVQIMKEKDIAPELPEDLVALMKRLATVRKHVDSNKNDEKAKRGILLTKSKINRLVKHYKKAGVLSQDWKMDAERIGYYAA